MFLNIFLKSKRKWLTFVVIFVVIIFTASIFMMFINIDKIQNGKFFNSNLDLSFSNYYVQYDMTVISNKNINTYSVKEWHKQDAITRMEYLDYMKNTVTITLQGDTCSIVNSGNTAKLVINNMIDNKNIASLSTFAYLYEMVESCTESSCNCSTTQRIKDNDVVVNINLHQNCTCRCNEFTKQLKISKLELIFQNGIPKNYIVYDKNKNEYISIIYNVYEKDIEI